MKHLALSEQRSQKLGNSNTCAIKLLQRSFVKSNSIELWLYFILILSNTGISFDRDTS